MKNLLTLPAPSTARLAGLDLLVFPLDPVLDRIFSNRRWILSLRNARGQLVLLPTLQFMVLLGRNIHVNANLHNLMLVVREHGLVFNLDKCVIKERMITFFGMLFDAGGSYSSHPGPTGCPRTPVLPWYSNIHGSFHSKSVCFVWASEELA